MARITVRPPRGKPAVHAFAGDVITIGRSRGNDLVVSDSALSRFHVELRQREGEWWITDRGSRNGTLLNGEPLLVRSRIASGDRITVGETVLEFSTDAPRASRAHEPERGQVPQAAWRDTFKLGTQPVDGPVVSAAVLFERIVTGGESFWDVVERPLLDGSITREEVRALVERAWRLGGRSVRGVARLFRLEEETARLRQFLDTHRLRAR